MALDMSNMPKGSAESPGMPEMPPPPPPPSSPDRNLVASPAPCCRKSCAASGRSRVHHTASMTARSLSHKMSGPCGSSRGGGVQPLRQDMATQARALLGEDLPCCAASLDAASAFMCQL